MSDTLVKVENVSKKFCRSLKKSLWYGMLDLGHEIAGSQRDDCLRPDEFWAVRDVSFEIRRGECLGLIGPNGAGKTTLLKMLNGLIKPDGGRIEIRGQVGALIALGAGFNPILTGRENVYVNAAVLGLSEREVSAKLDEIIEFAELGDSIDAPVQTYSSGMVVRLGFSIATTIRPSVLILDEILAVGDVSFRDRCYQRIGELLKDSAVIMVSHDAHAIHRLADSAVLLHKGCQVDRGATDQLLALYTSLFKSTPTTGQKTTTAPWISHFNISASTASRQADGNTASFDLLIRLSFKSERAATISQALGNITGNAGAGPIAGQFDFLRLMSNISPGDNSLAFKISGLLLARGTYTCTIVAFCGNGRELAFAARDFCVMEQSVNVRFGAMYAPRCEPLALE